LIIEPEIPASLHFFLEKKYEKKPAAPFVSRTSTPDSLPNPEPSRFAPSNSWVWSTIARQKYYKTNGKAANYKVYKYDITVHTGLQFNFALAANGWKSGRTGCLTDGSSGSVLEDIAAGTEIELAALRNVPIRNYQNLRF